MWRAVLRTIRTKPGESQWNYWLTFLGEVCIVNNFRFILYSVCEMSHLCKAFNNIYSVKWRLCQTEILLPIMITVKWCFVGSLLWKVGILCLSVLYSVIRSICSDGCAVFLLAELFACMYASGWDISHCIMWTVRNAGAQRECPQTDAPMLIGVAKKKKIPFFNITDRSFASKLMHQCKFVLSGVLWPKIIQIMEMSFGHPVVGRMHHVHPQTPATDSHMPK